jgi:hypothetical protein
MFLAGTQSLSQRGLTALVQLSPPREIRICWVPRLRGGENTLTAPFAARDGKRILFRAVKVVPLGALLGVVYRSRGPA